MYRESWYERPAFWFWLSILLAMCAFALAGCASPTRPAPAPASAKLLTATVTVVTTLTNIDGPALAGVRIAVDGRASAVTDAAGRATLIVPAGREITIAVRHPHYEPYIPSASAALNAGAWETWRFAFIPAGSV